MALIYMLVVGVGNMVTEHSRIPLLQAPGNHCHFLRSRRTFVWCDEEGRQMEEVSFIVDTGRKNRCLFLVRASEARSNEVRAAWP